MNLAETVYKTLRQEYESGLTQEEVAKKHNVRHSQIQPILSGKRSAGGIQLETFDKMFPHASFNLNGDGNIIASNVRVTHMNVNTNTSSPITHEQIRSAVDAFRHEVIDAIISLNIPPDALQAVLKAIKGLVR